MSVRILQPGLLTTIQDLGRFGFQKFGLCASGAMDPYAAAIANILVGNGRDCAVLECFFLGPTIQFQQDTVFSITGGNFSPCLDHQPVQTYLPVAAHSGQILSFSGSSEGCRLTFRRSWKAVLQICVLALAVFREESCCGATSLLWVPPPMRRFLAADGESVLHFTVNLFRSFMSFLVLRTICFLHRQSNLFSTQSIQ